MSLQDIVNVSITTATANPSQAGFGTPLLACYHTHWTDRARSYTGLAAMAADGFSPRSPAYKMATAIFAQNPRPPRLKVGRRASAPTQVINLTPSSPTTGVVYSFDLDGTLVSYTALSGDNTAAVCTGLASAANALAGFVASATAIVATGGVSSASPQALTTTALNGAVGTGVMNPPRALEFVFSSNAAWHATTITVTGKSAAGLTITDTFAVPANGGATVKGAKLFASVTEIDIPAQGGSGGTFTAGYPARAVADGTSGTHVVVTTTTPGELLTYDSWAGPVASVPSLALFDATADPGIVADLTAIALVDNDWYGLDLDSNSKAEVLAAAPWVEASGKVFAAQSADDACLDPSSTTDVMYVAKAEGLFRTTIFYAPNVQNNPIAAAILGSRLPAPPGSDTWAYKQLATIASYALTDTQANAVRAKNGNTYLVVANVAITQNGTVAGGEFVDVIRFRDWLQAGIQADVFTVLVTNPKIPYTDGSVSMVKGVVRGRLKKGAAQPNNGIDDSQPMLVSAPKVADVADADRKARHLPDIQFSCRLSNAIHTLDIAGTISV